MTNESARDVPAEAEDQIRAGEDLLNSGETESLIDQAVETIALARAKGRLDIVEQAGALIRELSEQHAALTRAHAELVAENSHLQAAHELLRAADAQYREAVEALDKTE